MAEEKRIISVFFVILQSLIYTVFAMDERLDKVKVQCDYLPLINFAIQQNGASIIHQLSIENTTPAPLKDIQVQITTEPTFGNAAPIAVAQIPPNESICLSSFNLTLSANYFTQLTERLSGNLKIEITSEAESVFCQTYPIDILAYDQWGGLNVLPEMLAAFITPNHTAIVPIIKRAASILGQWTDNPSLDEYQSRPPGKETDGRHLHGYHGTTDYIQHHPRQLRGIWATCTASRLRNGTKTGNLSGYGLALCFLPGSNRSECTHYHHSRAYFCGSLASAGDFSGSYH